MLEQFMKEVGEKRNAVRASADSIQPIPDDMLDQVGGASNGNFGAFANFLKTIFSW